MEWSGVCTLAFTAACLSLSLILNHSSLNLMQEELLQQPTVHPAKYMYHQYMECNLYFNQTTDSIQTAKKI